MLKRDVVALWLAARDHRTPWAARGVAMLVAGYALSPIDLIPDFIPVLGLIDDVIVVPAGIWFALRLVPPPLMSEFRQRAETLAERPRSLGGALVVAAVWLAAAGGAAWCWLERA